MLGWWPALGDCFVITRIPQRPSVFLPDVGERDGSPVFNETGLAGRFDLKVTGGVNFAHDLTARMHEQLDLKVTRSQREC